MPPRVTVIQILDTMMLFEMLRQQREALTQAQSAAEALQCRKMIRLYQGGIELHLWEQRN